MDMDMNMYESWFQNRCEGWCTIIWEFKYLGGYFDMQINSEPAL